MKKYFLDPFGCVKNQVDAENMMAFLNDAGWESVSSAEDADVIIVNSCAFIESAKQESINAVLEWRKSLPNAKIILSGCLAQRYSNELSKSLPEADCLFGVEDISQIVSAAEAALAAAVCGSAPGEVMRETPALLTGERPLLSLPCSAYVKISEGCDNRCSFCAIPLIRGRLRSRAVPGIVEECRVLLARGIKEICIIGQDTGSFGTDGKENAVSKLPELLDAVSSLEGRFWVRLLYIHPDHFPFSILDIMEKDPRFLPYFDIPFQHASPALLHAMNRRGAAEGYLDLLSAIRGRLPNAVIRSTFLLGFPGETENDFKALLDFQDKAALDWLGCFAYSREEGTKAYSLPAQVSRKTALRRKKIIEERQIAITEKKMDRFTGQTLDALVEEEVDERLLLGRLYCQAPDVDGLAVIVGAKGVVKPGCLVSCKVVARRGFDLEVRIVEEEINHEPHEQNRRD
ncbi:MAG: 30S ribosomal protein S12 methylthiotransferase RimO [Treponema sp.]|nr:30S ribosomal protein S12 methylthiotransferase RimO [Treponema sp.]